MWNDRVNGTYTNVLGITSGQVGIGTTVPSAPLTIGDYQVSGAGADGIVAEFITATANTGDKCGIQFGVDLQSSASRIYGVVEATNKSALTFETKSGASNYAERMRISNQGNVGIGTSVPSEYSDLTLGNQSSLCLKETTTPISEANFGKIYTKSDNNLYFQDGAGAENSISFGGGASWSSAPASGTAAGNAGDRAYDSNYYYVCVATNTWKRTSLATW